MQELEQTLHRILTEDPLGILDLATEVSFETSEDQRFHSGFAEIQAFFHTHNRLPIENSRDVHERKLHTRLQVYRDDVAIVEMLHEVGHKGWLRQSSSSPSVPHPATSCLVREQDAQRSEPVSWHRLLTEYPYDLLSTAEQGHDIFALEHVSPAPKVTSPYVANRQPCEDFGQFRSSFRQCYEHLHTGKRCLQDLEKRPRIAEGDFFVLKNELVYIAALHAQQQTQDRPHQRLRCIFKNHTQAHLLKQESFLKALRAHDGKRIAAVSDPRAHERDHLRGYLYVARSLSQRQNVRSIPHLHKIGYSSCLSAVRIHKAEKSSTYLKDEVEIVKEVPCYYGDVKRMEELLHRFFEPSRVAIELQNARGECRKPREWYMVPLAVIAQAITHVLGGSINEHCYDPENMCIHLK